MPVGIDDLSQQVRFLFIEGRGNIRPAEKNNAVGFVDDCFKLKAAGIRSIENISRDILGNRVEFEPVDLIVFNILSGVLIIGFLFCVIDADHDQVGDVQYSIFPEFDQGTDSAQGREEDGQPDFFVFGLGRIKKPVLGLRIKDCPAGQGKNANKRAAPNDELFQITLLPRPNLVSKGVYCSFITNGIIMIRGCFDNIFCRIRLMQSSKRKLISASVESYAGSRGEETPRFVIMGEQRFGIKTILQRERIQDIKTNEIREVFLCRLENGDVIRLERRDSGDWTVKR